MAEVQRTWPDSAAAWSYGLSIAMWAGHSDRAMAMINSPPWFQAPESLRHWKLCVTAMQSPDRASIAGAERDAIADSYTNQNNLRSDLQCLSMLGRVDAAYAVSERYQPEIYAFDGSGIFFFPSTAAMRRDPRFMKLAAKIGLVDYWRLTGKWPDFCAEPGLPYDCKAEAAKLAHGRAD